MVIQESFPRHLFAQFISFQPGLNGWLLSIVNSDDIVYTVIRRCVQCACVCARTCVCVCSNTVPVLAAYSFEAVHYMMIGGQTGERPNTAFCYHDLTTFPPFPSSLICYGFGVAGPVLSITPSIFFSSAPTHVQWHISRNTPFSSFFKSYTCLFLSMCGVFTARFLKLSHLDVSVAY